jgi:hypothetical protein
MTKTTSRSKTIRMTKTKMSSLAEIVGLRSDASVPAIKAAALAYVSLGKAVMAATDTRNPSAALGALQALVDEAVEVGALRAELKQRKIKAVAAEKMDLLRKLSAANLPGYPRGELFVDREVNGQLIAGPAPMYAEMKLATLRGFVDAKLSGKAPSSKSPFDPNRAAAEEGRIEALAGGLESGSLVDATAQHSSAPRADLAKSAAALQAKGII